MHHQLRPCLVAVVVALAVSCGDGPRDDQPQLARVPPDAASRPQNVLIVVMDTTRADRCSVHGYDRPTTPNLEALAADGVAFDTAWAPSSWTVPSHASLFTGLLPTRHGADADLSWTLPAGATTLAETLRDAGYATGGFSNNHFVSETFGLSQGFTTFMPIFSERGLPGPGAARAHDAALQWMRRQIDRNTPFFAFINDTEPHAPYAPRDDDQARFLRSPPSAVDLAWARAWEFPATLPVVVGQTRLRDEQVALVSDLYDAEIAGLDREIGRLVAGLRELGALENTLVIVTADHGEQLGENGHFAHSLTMLPPVLHVPLVIRHPRHFTGGRRVADVVRLQDVFPTVLEVCGLPVPPNLDAASLLGDVSGRLANGRLGRPRGILTACARDLPGADVSHLDVVQRSAFDGRFLLVERQPGGDATLRDLRADPLGLRDVLADHPDVADRLRAALPAAISASKPAPAPGDLPAGY